MHADTPDPVPDPLAEPLLAYDAALAQGTPPLDAPDKMVPEAEADRLRAVQAFLRRLEDVWPRGPAEPACTSADVEDELRLAHSWEGPIRVGRFRILRELGRGGCGIVFLAFDPVLGRRVALKVPRAEALLTPDLRLRFLREAQLAAGLEHAHIVPVHEAGEAGAVCYIVSAYIPGTDLATWLKRQNGPVSAATAATLVATLADAIQHAHDRGVVHRDLKPSNVLIVARDSWIVDRENQPDTPRATNHEPRITPKITDFGLARLLEREMDETTTGVILGTPAYMAPEQAECRVRDVGPATDVYALGTILYELLTGRPPFWGETPLETLEQVRTLEPVPPRRLRPTVPRPLEVICLKCLAKPPRQRYATAGELALDLRRFLNNEPIHARSPGLLSRLGLWCRRPERIRDAGSYGMICGTALTLWCLFGLVFLASGNLPVERPGELAVHLLLFITGVYLPMAWIGWKVKARKLPALWAGAAFTILLLGLIAFVNFWNYAYDSGGLDNDSNPALRSASDLLLCILIAAQLAGYVIALVAYYSNRDAVRRHWLWPGW